MMDDFLHVGVGASANANRILLLEDCPEISICRVCALGARASPLRVLSSFDSNDYTTIPRRMECLRLGDISPDTVFYAAFMVLSYMSCSEILPLDNVLGGPVLKPEQKTYDGWNDN